MAKIYALYKDNELLDVGTIRDIAKRQGVKEATLRMYHTPRRKEKNKHGKILLSVEEGEKNDQGK